MNLMSRYSDWIQRSPGVCGLITGAVLAVPLCAWFSYCLRDALFVDRGACLASHDATWLQPQYMPDAKGNLQLIGMIPMTSTQCDQWQFPSGRPK